MRLARKLFDWSQSARKISKRRWGEYRHPPIDSKEEVYFADHCFLLGHLPPNNLGGGNEWNWIFLRHRRFSRHVAISISMMQFQFPFKAKIALMTQRTIDTARFRKTSHIHLGNDILKVGLGKRTGCFCVENCFFAFARSKIECILYDTSLDTDNFSKLLNVGLYF